MDPVILTILIVLCRMVIIHSLLQVYLGLRTFAAKRYRYSFLTGAIIYVCYLSTSTLNYIPHTFDDFLRVIAGTIMWYVVSKYIRRKTDG